MAVFHGKFIDNLCEFLIGFSMIKLVVGMYIISMNIIKSMFGYHRIPLR